MYVKDYFPNLLVLIEILHIVLNDLTVFSRCLFVQCRTGELESAIEEDKQKAIQVELLKKENAKLISQLTAQESVVDGLKMERKIWGQELAEQGKIMGFFSFAEKKRVFNILRFK